VTASLAHMCGAAVAGPQREVVDNEQVDGHEATEFEHVGVVKAARLEPPEELVGRLAVHREATLDGEPPESVGEHCLADAHGAHEQDVMVLFDEAKGAKLVQQAAVVGDAG